MNNSILKKYELMRKKIDILKKQQGFKCYKCGSCCNGPKNSITKLDFEYMKEKGVDLSGIEVEGEGLYTQRELKLVEHHCYYYDEQSKLCKIHPYNPMLCYTYPFVVNVDLDNFTFKYCLREQNGRQYLVSEDLRTLLRNLYQLEFKDEEE